MTLKFVLWFCIGLYFESCLSSYLLDVDANVSL